MAEVVGITVATAEVDKWLEYMDVLPEQKAKDGVQEAVNRLIAAVQSGMLVFNPDETVTQKLKYPLGESGATSEMVYDFRFTVGDYAKKTKGVFESLDLALVKLELIGKHPKMVFEKMKRSDFQLASALTVFF